MSSLEPLKARLTLRIPNINSEIADEMLLTAKDRLLIRVGLKTTDEIPPELHSICVEVASAMYRRYEAQNEGVETERVDVFSIKFVNDLLGQYDSELYEIRKNIENSKNTTKNKVRFL